MRTVDIIPFELDHMRKMNENCEGIGIDELLSDNSENDGSGSYTDDNGKVTTYTGMMVDKVVGCGGVRILWEGVGEIWATYPLTIKKHLRESLWVTKEIMNRLIKEHGLWRVQATSRENFPGGCKWLSRLGLKMEGLMSRYNPDGTDAWLFAKVTT